MKGHFVLLLVVVLSGTAYAAPDKTTPGKADLMSDMQKSFDPRQQAKDAERVRHLQDITGQEWLELSLGERMDHVMAAMYVLDGQGVKMRRSLNDYCNLVERELLLHSDLYDAHVTDILTAVVYQKEPTARAALDKFREQRSK